MQTQILVTGATGTVGGLAARSLSRAGVPVRALVRDPAKAGDLADRGVALYAGSFDEPEAMRASLRDVDTAVLITPASERAAEQASAFLAAARSSGVRKIVRLSAIKASADGPTDNTRLHARTERELQESGFAFVALRPQFFMQNLLGSASPITQQGTLHSGMGDGRIAMIDARDVASCVEQAALRSDFDGRAVELTGPRAVTHDEVAAALGAALGREVEHVDVGPEAAADAVRAFGVGEWLAGLMRDYASAYRHGYGDFVTDAVETLTGTEPRDIHAFAREVFASRAAGLAEGAR